MHRFYYKIKRPLVPVPVLTSGLLPKAPVSLRPNLPMGYLTIIIHTSYQNVTIS